VCHAAQLCSHSLTVSALYGGFSAGVENPFGGEYPPIQYLSYPKFFGAAAFLFCVHMLVCQTFLFTFSFLFS
jgi:hypothetical protein